MIAAAGAVGAGSMTTRILAAVIVVTHALALVAIGFDSVSLFAGTGSHDAVYRFENEESMWSQRSHTNYLLRNLMLAGVAAFGVILGVNAWRESRRAKRALMLYATLLFLLVLFNLSKWHREGFGWLLLAVPRRPRQHAARGAGLNGPFDSK